MVKKGTEAEIEDAKTGKVVGTTTKRNGKTEEGEASIFTKIIDGEIPCYKIYEDERTVAFLDINPEVWGHTLVVPKVQVDRIYDLPEEDFRALMDTAKKLSQHYEKTTGKRVVWKVVGTDVPHAHVHVEPLDETWFQGRHLEFSPEEFEEIREKLVLKD